MLDKKNNKVIVILGPTSSGKTSIGTHLAYELNGEIVSADSRQVYCGMDIGTGKDLEEYVVEGEEIKYHMIDIADPQSKFSLAEFQKLAFVAIDDILNRAKLPIIVGGTGQYLEAVIDNYILSDAKPNEKLRQELEESSLDQLYKRIERSNEAFAKKINESDIKNKRRLIRYVEVIESSKGQFRPLKAISESKYEFLVIGIRCSREILNERIDKRIKDRLENEGMVEEVENLNRDGLSFKRLEEFGLEYKYIAKYLQDELEYDDMVTQLSQASRKFAKRQMTWYRRWEKLGREIHWVDKKEEADKLIKKFLKT